MTNVLLIGAGKIGRAICKFLGHTGDYKTTVADTSKGALEKLVHVPNTETRYLDVTDTIALGESVERHDNVISALSFSFNPLVAEACLASGVSYFDLTEDIATTQAVQELSQSAREGQIFMPQCGLAPGFTGIIGNDLASRFDQIDSLLLRVGALPIYPTNALKYNLTWSTDGLINEYCNPCEVIHQESITQVLPLEGMEHFSIDGVRYEAFNTSGGLGTLCDSLQGKANTLNYKTVRYPGHRDLANFLVNELKLGNQRENLRQILENAIPITLQDVVLVFCTATGKRKGQLTQISDARKIYHGNVLGEEWSAIQITTAAGICAALDLHVEGKLPRKGFVRQEEIPLSLFLENRFGEYFEYHNKNTLVKPLDLVIEEG